MAVISASAALAVSDTGVYHVSQMEKYQSS